MSAWARLVWERLDGAAVEFPLEGDALEVGRDVDVAIHVDEPLVSRRHARLEKRGETWVLIDLGSTSASSKGRSRSGSSPARPDTRSSARAPVRSPSPESGRSSRSPERRSS